MLAVPVPEEAIDRRLAAWGLVRESQSALAPALSRNRTILCRGPKGHVLVKVACGPIGGVMREGEALSALWSLVGARAPLGLPRVFGFDRNEGLLAIEWLDGAETLHHFHHRTDTHAPEPGERPGRAVGYLHRLSGKARTAAAFRPLQEDPPDLLEMFLRMRPDFYARLSPASLTIFSNVQNDGSALRALSSLSAAQGDRYHRSLLHGDLRPANVLQVPTARATRLVLLDWELCGFGDAARDLGGLLSEYLLEWLDPEVQGRGLSSATLNAFARGLLAGYQDALDRDVDEAFMHRAVQWLSTALLFYVYGMTHYDGELSTRARRIAHAATQALGAPQEWAALLWGGV